MYEIVVYFLNTYMLQSNRKNKRERNPCQDFFSGFLLVLAFLGGRGGRGWWFIWGGFYFFFFCTRKHFSMFSRIWFAEHFQAWHLSSSWLNPEHQTLYLLIHRIFFNLDSAFMSKRSHTNQVPCFSSFHRCIWCIKPAYQTPTIELTIKHSSYCHLQVL